MQAVLKELDTKKADAETFRKPNAGDGAAIWKLVGDCSPLDENSMYCNLIQCDHFRDTCVLVELDGDVVGWVSGHILPSSPDTFFVWQVAVSEKARGMGLARRMLEDLMTRDECAGVNRMQTTITLDNKASWGLFTRFAEANNGSLSSDPHFKRDDHFAGQHATEHMVTIKLAEPLKKAA